MSRPRAVLVEDEMLVAVLTEDMLTELGWRVVAVAGSLPRALELARTVDADAAILDVNLGGRSSAEAADLFAERGVPVIFATGYGAAGLEPRHRRRPVLSKPFEIEDLRRALERAVGPG